MKLSQQQSQIEQQKPVRLPKTKVDVKVGERHGIPKNAQTYFVKIPNFLKLQSKLFHKGDSVDENEREKFANATSIIRCMEKDNQIISNARIITWDDGSRQLVVGNEVYNMRFNPVDNW